MQPKTSYTRTPIVEALLDIQIETPLGVSLDSLLKCQRSIRKDYPSRREAQNHTGHLLFGEKVSATAVSESVGSVFASHDGKRLFQAKKTGFTFNQLTPYPGWNGFISEAKRLWSEYRKVVSPSGYTRVALRYINRFDFPEPMLNLETYFRTYPEISRDLPQVIEGFFFQFQLPVGEADTIATVTQTLIEPLSENHSSIMLDIDVYRTCVTTDEGELWRFLETLRSWKNKVFEASITNKTREMLL